MIKTLIIIFKITPFMFNTTLKPFNNHYTIHLTYLYNIFSIFLHSPLLIQVSLKDLSLVTMSFKILLTIFLMTTSLYVLSILITQPFTPVLMICRIISISPNLRLIPKTTYSLGQWMDFNFHASKWKLLYINHPRDSYLLSIRVADVHLQESKFLRLLGIIFSDDKKRKTTLNSFRNYLTYL